MSDILKQRTKRLEFFGSRAWQKIQQEIIDSNRATEHVEVSKNMIWCPDKQRIVPIVVDEVDCGDVIHGFDDGEGPREAGE